MLRSALALGLAIAFLAAGCVSPKVDPALGASTPATRALLDALAAAPAPVADGARHDKWLSDFVANYAPRITGTPGEKAAGDAMAAELKSLGYTVSVLTFNAQSQPDPNGPLRAVVALKLGTVQPKSWILLGAHYDTSVLFGPRTAPAPIGPGLTIQAAYDNGSGTSFVMQLARMLKNYTSEKTIGFVLFNGEEEGLLASQAFVENLQKDAKIEAYLGFDMIGINWPSKTFPLCLYSGRAFNATFVPVLRAVAFDWLQYPEGAKTVVVFDNHDKRSSDEASFAAAKLPTIRFAGGQNATDYPAYHHLDDTMDTIYRVAGGRDAWQAGLAAAEKAAYYVVVGVDHTVVEPFA